MAWELAALLIIAVLAATVVGLRRRTMKKGRLEALRRAVSNPTGDSAGSRYFCPFHPHVRAASPGRCPNCQRNLVRQEPSAGRSGETGAGP